MTIQETIHPTPTDWEAVERSLAAPRLDVVEVSQHVGDKQTLHRVSFTVQPGEIVAIAGGSGAGKTTLLEALVGIRPASGGWVLVDGTERDMAPGATRFGYVPQDDIIHTELGLRRTLEHAARLRLCEGCDPLGITEAVTRTLEQLDLVGRDDVPVGELSGGQRKRASIAAELLTAPNLFFLDEPTSGLDPATGAGLMRELQRLAARGTTIVLTTHAPEDLAKCDRVVFLARDGHLAFSGTPAEARDYFDVDDLAAVYDVLARTGDPESLNTQFEASDPGRTALVPPTVSWPRSEETDARDRRVGAFSQWRTLTKRNLDLLRKSKLTLAILLGSPVMVVGMMAVLFGPGTFGADQASAMPAIQTLFWVAFASFFFGVTYGLLQVVGEFAIFRRERFGGLSVVAYVTSKLAVLVPLLVAVNAAMLLILQGLGRLPGVSGPTWITLLITFSLVSAAALAVGLLASASVQNSAQATLALPMLCFPQVLFAGAVVPLADMAGAGKIMSYALASRWGFESAGRSLDVGQLIGNEAAAAGYGPAFDGTVVAGWAVLAVITTLMVAGTVAILDRRSRRA